MIYIASGNFYYPRYRNSLHQFQKFVTGFYGYKYLVFVVHRLIFNKETVFQKLALLLFS
jgi:hypothetical protein